jgi:hypothetical protein
MDFGQRWCILTTSSGKTDRQAKAPAPRASKFLFRRAGALSLRRKASTVFPRLKSENPNRNSDPGEILSRFPKGMPFLVVALTFAILLPMAATATVTYTYTSSTTPGETGNPNYDDPGATKLLDGLTGGGAANPTDGTWVGW